MVQLVHGNCGFCLQLLLVETTQAFWQKVLHGLVQKQLWWLSGSLLDIFQFTQFYLYLPWLAISGWKQWHVHKCGNCVSDGLELPMLQITFPVVKVVLFQAPFPFGNQLGITALLPTNMFQR